MTALPLNGGSGTVHSPENLVHLQLIGVFYANIQDSDSPMILRLSLLIALLFLNACSITRLPQDLGYGVLNHGDLQTARDGLPTYLLLLDGALITYPENKALLLAAANLNAAFAGVFVVDEDRKLKMTGKAFKLAQDALCQYRKRICQLKSATFEAFETQLSGFTQKKDLPYLYALASTWTAYIQLTSDDFNSIAELARVEQMMKHIVSVNPDYEHGMPYVYLGALASILPPSLGGKPEQARGWFEKAIAVSQGRNLIAQVVFAEKYARLMFDQSLHDKLLNDVLVADSQAHGLTLQNEYAKKEARRLLGDSSEYFE